MTGGRAAPGAAVIALCAAMLALYAALLLGLRLVPWHDAILFPACLWLTMRAIAGTRADGKGRLALLAAVTTAYLALGLAYVWLVGYAGRNHVFAGLFGLSDAGEYYWDAERVLHGQLMNTGGARRPIFSAVLAGLLRLVGQDIRLAHVAMMLAWAGSGAFAVREIWRTHGHRVASIVFVVFVLYARRYVGFVQSEGIGAPVGALAFGLLWRAAWSAKQKDWEASYLGALLLQTIALLGRPGPIFVVAGMVAWALRRAPRDRRLALVLRSAGVIAAGALLQAVVRRVTTSGDSFSDLPPILYGLLHGEDSSFVWRHNPWLGDISEEVRTSAVWHLLGREAFARPWLVVLAPLRCLAAWLYLPQGFFGMVWMNPDDRALENARAVKQSMADHGIVGPIVLWVQTLGLYSFVNAIVMGAGAVAFVGALVRAAVRAGRDRARTKENLWPVALGVLVSLPALPPWITEGAQILASVFFLVVAFVATSFLPRRRGNESENEHENESEHEHDWALPLGVALGLAGLVALATVFPRLPPETACGETGEYLADVDRAAASYTDDRDTRDNLVLLTKSNPTFALGIRQTLDRPRRIFPAYDACGQRMLYVVEDGQTPRSTERSYSSASGTSKEPRSGERSYSSASGTSKEPRSGERSYSSASGTSKEPRSGERWRWLHTMRIGKKPLEIVVSSAGPGVMRPGYPPASASASAAAPASEGAPPASGAMQTP